MHLSESADASSQTLTLSCHPETPCQTVRQLSVRVHRRPDRSIALSYALEGDLALLLTPAPRSAERIDGLWRHTCFEVFVGNGAAAGYCEFNFSPSSQWAAYAFTGCRVGMLPLAMLAPEMTWRQLPERLALDVVLPPEALPPGRLRLGLSAVVETADGSLSYWALRHPPGRADFHHPDTFILELP